MLKSNWSDIIGSDSDTESMAARPLGGEPPKSDCTSVDPQGAYNFLAVTLNHPRTPVFLQANSRIQKLMYCKLWGNMQNCLGFGLHNHMVFEHCESGQIHLHGYMELPKGACIAGAISDVTKAYLNQLPKKYSKFKENCYNVGYKRYRDASICCAYRDCQLPPTDIGSTAYWREYMQKDQK